VLIARPTSVRRACASGGDGREERFERSNEETGRSVSGARVTVREPHLVAFNGENSRTNVRNVRRDSSDVHREHLACSSDSLGGALMHGSTGSQHPPPLVPLSVHSTTLGQSQERHAVQDLAANSGFHPLDLAAFGSGPSDR
jgi:hypothetical protein